MFTDRLKENTGQSHQQLEKRLIARMKEIRSVEQYLDLLQLFYGYFGGLEQNMQSLVNHDDFPDYGLRRKTSLLAADIEALGGVPNPFAAIEFLPELNNKLDAYGALYVIEGSTLGGKIISDMIGKHLNFADGNGLSFFTGYADQTETMWLGFKQSLNAVAVVAKGEESIINAANDTFRKFIWWIELKS